MQIGQLKIEMKFKYFVNIKKAEKTFFGTTPSEKKRLFIIQYSEHVKNMTPTILFAQ